MSVLEIPRIYFKGEVSWDPVTTNNYAPGDAAAGYDEKDCDSTLDAAMVRSANVSAFRTAAIDEVVASGNWNPAGSYRSPFYDTYVSGVDAGRGLDTTDAFVSSPVSFTGMLVDTEPYGAYSSQLFFDAMSFGIAGGCRIFGERVTRFTDRYINFHANPNNNMIAGVASVVWQTCFDKTQGLRVDAHDSAVLVALSACMEQPDVRGVMVRFVTYRTVYYAEPTLSNGAAATTAAGRALQDKLRAGGFQPNPARSLLVGTVGLWRDDDPMLEPGDRALLTTRVPIVVSDDPKRSAFCGSAWARVGADRLTLDLSNCIPWSDRLPTKVDLGELTIVAVDPQPGGTAIDVATLPTTAYDQSAYEATSGIVDIPIDSELAVKLRGLTLGVVDAKGTKYLDEASLRAIPGQPNLYIDEGDSVQTSVRVYERGMPAGAGITVTMSELGAATGACLSQVTDATGQVSFPLVGTTGSVVGLVFQPGSNPTLPVTEADFDTQIYTYMYLRVLPADAQIGAMEPSWDNVHDYVLSGWEAMAPCMDNWLPLGDEAQVLAYAPLIRRLTDPANFESFRFMPVTRDMTKGQRQLLHEFLGGEAELRKLVESSDIEVRPNHRTLSRAMRNH